MKNFVIVGTSAVGKSFLEDALVATGRFVALPKHTSRPPRLGEDPQKTVCLSSPEFNRLSQSDQFFFTLTYAGFHYAWKRSDLTKNRQKSIVLPLTLDALAPFLSQNPNFVPIFLRLTLSGLPLLRRRLSLRASPDLDHRLLLARQEIKKNASYSALVQSHHGLVFTIKDDSTLPLKVIPAIIAYDQK